MFAICLNPVSKTAPVSLFSLEGNEIGNPNPFIPFLIVVDRIKHKT